MSDILDVSKIVVPENISANTDGGDTSEVRQILTQIKNDEDKIEEMVDQAEVMSKQLNQSIAVYLKEVDPAGKNRSIFYEGMPDVLQAAARLLDISIGGRYKVSNLRKMRASILKDSGKSDGDDITGLMESL